MAMGRGIITRDGGKPLDDYAFRLKYLGSARLRKGVIRLLRGEAVASVDGELEISDLPVKGGGAWTLTIRDPDAEFPAELTVRPLDPAEIRSLASPDLRTPEPAPHQWQSNTSSGSADEWELFNCVIVSFLSV